MFTTEWTYKSYEFISLVLDTALQQSLSYLFIKDQFNINVPQKTHDVTRHTGSPTSAGRVYNVLSFVLEIITLRLL